MRKLSKVYSVSLLSLIILLGSFIPTHAEVLNTNGATLEEIRDELSILEVQQELIDFADELRIQLLTTTDADIIIQLQLMIESLGELSHYAELSDTSQKLHSTFSSQYDDDINSLGYQTGKTHAAWIISYFRNKGYQLAAELLTYATVNKSKVSTYYPTNSSKVRSSDFFNSLNTKISHSGSRAFTNANSSMDLYYALHLYNYRFTTSNKMLVITDYYDFEPEDNYGGLAGTAVRAMYNAQYYGAIVPYNVRIVQYK